MEERWWQDQLVEVPDDLIMTLCANTFQDQLGSLQLTVFRHGTNSLIGKWLDPVAPGQNPQTHIDEAVRKYVEVVYSHLRPFP